MRPLHVLHPHLSHGLHLDRPHPAVRAWAMALLLAAALTLLVLAVLLTSVNAPQPRWLRP